MKTNISKENAIKILTGAVKQQKVVNGLDEITGGITGDLFVHVSDLVSILFGIEIEEADADQEEEMLSAFMDTVEHQKCEPKRIAEIIYPKMKLVAENIRGVKFSDSIRKDFKIHHEGTIKEIIADAIVFDRITENLSVLSSNYFVGKGCLDFAQNVKGCTKAFALMGVDDRDSNHDIRFELEGIYKLALGGDMNSDHPNSTDHLVLAEQIYDSWMEYLSSTKAA